MLVENGKQQNLSSFEFFSDAQMLSLDKTMKR